MRERPCPVCRGQTIWDEEKCVFYCDECWVEVELCPDGKP